MKFISIGYVKVDFDGLVKVDIIIIRYVIWDYNRKLIEVRVIKLGKKGYS